MTKEHALLSASSSHRWLNCPPSARLSEMYADREEDNDQVSDYAAQGTDAHSLCEYKLKAALGLPAQDPTADLTHYDGEMEACAQGYAAYILERLAEAKETGPEPLVVIEQRLDFSAYVEEGFGRADCLIIAEGNLNTEGTLSTSGNPRATGTLSIVDYKHGQGVLVEAVDNPQLMLYALGALEAFGPLYDIATVSMTIYQPRRENISTHTMTREDLYRWAEEVLKPRAKLAFAGEGEFSAGEHCRFCPARGQCRARAEANLELAAYDFREPALLDPSEIPEILRKGEDLADWLADVKAYALKSALNGVKYAGFKVVEGRSTRRYRDELAVARLVSAAGFDPYERKLLGITAMTTMLGRKRFESLLGHHIVKPQGKPTLVPEKDVRPVFNNPQQDFAD